MAFQSPFLYSHPVAVAAVATAAAEPLMVNPGTFPFSFLNLKNHKNCFAEAIFVKMGLTIYPVEMR